MNNFIIGEDGIYQTLQAKAAQHNIHIKEIFKKIHKNPSTHIVYVCIYYKFTQNIIE